MAYTINKTNGTTITVADNAVDSTYSVQLVGKNRTNYGAAINQNFFRLMENFSSGSAPSSPQPGQVWFDTTYSTLKVWDSAYWKPLSGIAATTTTPSSPVSGELWFDTVNQQLKVYAGIAWVAINSGVAGGGTNVFITETVTVSNVSYYVSSLYASGVRVAILSKESVTGTGITGFGNLVAGITYNTSISTSTVNGSVVGNTAVFSGNITAGNINAVSGILSVTGNVNVGNIGTGIGIFTGAISVSGNANVGNIGATNAVITANATFGNINSVSGILNVSGNVTGLNFIGPLANGNSNITITANGNVRITSAGNANVLMVTGTGANIAGTLNATANANVANLGTGNAVITANATFGNINSVSGILSVTGNANVGNVGAVAGVFTGSLALKAPVTVTGATYTMLATDSSLIINASATCTVTLLAPATYPGRILNIKTVAAYTVVSAGSNVVPVESTSAGTAILAATAGKWAMLQSDGTNWVTMLAG